MRDFAEQSRRRDGRSNAASRTQLAPIMALAVAAAVAITPAEAAKKPKPKAPPPENAQENAAQAPEPQPYRPQITRLAEILGALTYLDEICAKGHDNDWRASMQALIEAQARSDLDKGLLAGAFNRSYRGYKVSYRVCTSNARTAIARFLAEGTRITRDVVDGYGAT